MNFTRQHFVIYALLLVLILFTNNTTLKIKKEAYFFKDDKLFNVQN